MLGVGAADDVVDELTLSGDASGITQHLRWKRSS